VAKKGKGEGKRSCKWGKKNSNWSRKREVRFSEIGQKGRGASSGRGKKGENKQVN